MPTTVEDVQKLIASQLDLTRTVTEGSTDWNLRLDFINRRQRMWSEVTNWQMLYTEYNSQVTTSLTTISLPSNFRKFAGYVKIDGDEYTEIAPQEQDRFTSSDDYYYRMYDSSTGRYNLIISGSIASGTSIYVPYYRTPASVVTSSDLINCPDNEYIIKGVMADVLESRNDDRYQRKQDEADLVLRNMMETENAHNKESDQSRVRTIEQNQYTYRWGED
jgi:hypothetical protein